MSLYPSLEDMKVDQMANAQLKLIQTLPQQPPSYPSQTANPSAPVMYPSLTDYMGLELSESVIAANMPEYSRQMSVYQQNQIAPSGLNAQLVAPISGQSVGLLRAQVTNGVRPLILCKDKENKVGIRVKEINNGIFVCLVIDGSPAALAGIRFGDQILQVNGQDVAGFTMDKVHKMLKESPVNGIQIVVRDRPFERTITLHKDSVGCIGFQFKNGKITTLVKDSSAARNGVLTDHQILEVDGRNVVGLKDKKIKEIIEDAGNVVTVTVIPSFIYDHMVKK